MSASLAWVRLEPRDRPAELLALHRVAPGRVEREARRAQAPHTMP